MPGSSVWFTPSIVQPSWQTAVPFINASKVIAYVDPLALDSGNDGIALGGIGAAFDLDADGQVEQVQWTRSTDPLLVMDVNHDGRINDGTELVDLTNGDKPLNLLSLDSGTKGGNGDGVLNQSDSGWSELQTNATKKVATCAPPTRARGMFLYKSRCSHMAVRCARRVSVRTLTY